MAFDITSTDAFVIIGFGLTPEQDDSRWVAGHWTRNAPTKELPSIQAHSIEYRYAQVSAEVVDAITGNVEVDEAFVRIMINDDIDVDQLVGRPTWWTKIVYNPEIPIIDCGELNVVED